MFQIALMIGLLFRFAWLISHRFEGYLTYDDVCFCYLKLLHLLKCLCHKGLNPYRGKLH